ncbi:MFS transporter [Fodinicola feengrottensis]|nr:MFS transporter [Fodinicola feengrottensis]
MALTAICLAGLMFGLEISSVPVILPTLGSVLHGGFADLQWIMNSYTIACVTVLVATGVLADRYGRKRVFAITVAAFGVTSLLCGFAPNIAVLILGRSLQGLSGGAMLICHVAILSHQFREGRQRSRAFGTWGLVFGFGLGFGPVVGGGLVAVLNWRWVFLVPVFVAAVTLVLLALGVRESRDPEARRLDIRGIGTLSLAVLGLTFYITQGADLGFVSPVELAVLGLSVAFFVAFVIVETTGKQAMFQFSLFRIRAFSGALLGCVGMNFSFWPLIIYLPIYLQHGLGYDVGTAAVVLLAFTLPTLVLPPIAERLALKYRPSVIIPLGLYVIGGGFLLLNLGSGIDHPSWLTILPGLLLSGIGLGLTSTPVTNTTTASVPSNRSGMASGIDMSARLVTLAVNISVMGLLLSVGILDSLRERLAGKLPGQQVRALATHVANGDDPVALHHTFPQLTLLDPTGGLVPSALARGFGMVTLYGGMGVWVLATASLITFGLFRRSVSTSRVVESASGPVDDHQQREPIND